MKKNALTKPTPAPTTTPEPTPDAAAIYRAPTTDGAPEEKPEAPAQPANPEAAPAEPTPAAISNTVLRAYARSEAAPVEATPEAAAPELSPAPAPAAFSAADVEAAEQRGYLRGRNERIEELMREPSVFERQGAPAPSHDWQEDSSPMILNNPRISIWDR